MTENPMSLTSDDVKRVAKLARLGLTDVETTETLAQLNSILELVDQMQQIDTDDVAPLAHPLELNLSLSSTPAPNRADRSPVMKRAPPLKQKQRPLMVSLRWSQKIPVCANRLKTISKRLPAPPKFESPTPTVKHDC